jgi:hypothetical protein
MNTNKYKVKLLQIRKINAQNFLLFHMQNIQENKLFKWKKRYNEMQSFKLNAFESKSFHNLKQQLKKKKK